MPLSADCEFICHTAGILASHSWHQGPNCWGCCRSCASGLHPLTAISVPPQSLPSRDNQARLQTSRGKSTTARTAVHCPVLRLLPRSCPPVQPQLLFPPVYLCAASNLMGPRTFPITCYTSRPVSAIDPGRFCQHTHHPCALCTATRGVLPQSQSLWLASAEEGRAGEGPAVDVPSVQVALRKGGQAALFL